MRLCCISKNNVDQHSLGVGFLFIVNVEGAIYKDEKWLLIRRSEMEEHAGGTLSLVGGKVNYEGSFSV